jgi:hypothetical protein
MRMAKVVMQELDPVLRDHLAEINRLVPFVRTIDDLRRLAHRSHEILRGRVFSDSTADIREDRER